MTVSGDEVRESAEIGSNGDKFFRDAILGYFNAG